MKDWFQKEICHELGEKCPLSSTFKKEWLLGLKARIIHQIACVRKRGI